MRRWKVISEENDSDYLVKCLDKKLSFDFDLKLIIYIYSSTVHDHILNYFNMQ